MARQNGLLGIKGNLGELSFYPSVFGNIVRRKGGASREKIRKAPEFRNLRLHQSEFKVCAAAGKLLRQRLKPYTRQCHDHTLVWRITGLMHAIKNHDKISSLGKRSVASGLSTREGKRLLLGFDMNVKNPLKSILKITPAIVKSELTIEGLVPRRDIKAPAGATHLKITALFSDISFQTHAHDLQSALTTIRLNRTKQNIILGSGPRSGKEVRLITLLMVFQQEVNGAMYDLRDGNTMGVVWVE